MKPAPTIAAVIIAGLLAFAATAFLPSRTDLKDTEAFTAPGLDPLTRNAAQTEFWRLTPALLLVVYEAFAKTEETEIYDTLASVTHGAALDYLYLERIGAMAGGGLEEADQTIHEIKLLQSDALRADPGLLINATWQVIGTVGHAEHLHVRGNTYRAALTLAPIAGAWRITDFDLREVNRDAAGEVFAAPEADG